MTAATHAATTAHAGRPTCRWCGVRIRLLHAGGVWAWVHLDAGYSCRGPGRAVLPTHAEPPPAR